MIDRTASHQLENAAETARAECHVLALRREPGHYTTGFLVGVDATHRYILAEIDAPGSTQRRMPWEASWGDHEGRLDLIANRAATALDDDFEVTSSAPDLSASDDPAVQIAAFDAQTAWFQGFATGASHMRVRFRQA